MWMLEARPLVCFWFKTNYDNDLKRDVLPGNLEARNVGRTFFVSVL